MDFRLIKFDFHWILGFRCFNGFWWWLGGWWDLRFGIIALAGSVRQWENKCWYPFSRHILYEADSTKPNFLIGSIHVLFFYFILLSMAQAHATHEGNWESVVWRVWVGSFQIFCMSPTYACYQVGKRHWWHLRLMEEVLYPKFPHQKSFYALGDCAPNFQPSSIFHTKTQLTLN